MHLNRSQLKTGLVIAAIAIVALAAVIFISSDEGKSDADQIDDTITRAYTENDPSLCTELLTPKFIAQSAYRTLDTCKRTAAIGSNAQSVDVLDTRVDGDTATALVTATGGSASSKPVLLQLVKEDGDWKIDGFSQGKGG